MHGMTGRSGKTSEPGTYVKSLAPLPAGLPKLDSYSRPNTCPALSKIPLPTCWGSRGSPWSSRCLTIGGPAKPVCLAESPQLQKPASPMKLYGSPQQSRQKDGAKRIVNASPRKPKMKCIAAPSTSPDVSMMSMSSTVSTRSITVSDSWRFPGYLGAQDREQLGDLCRVIREEFTACHTQKEVEQVNRTANKIANEGNSMHFCMTGRLASRLREAAQAICSGGTFASFDYRHQLAFRKILRCEMKRRIFEIAGWGEREAEELAVTTHALDKDFPDRIVPDSPLVLKSAFLEAPSSARLCSRPHARNETGNNAELSLPPGPISIPAQVAELDVVVDEVDSSEIGDSFNDACHVDVERMNSSGYQRGGSTVSFQAKEQVSRGNTISGLQEKARASARASIWSQKSLMNEASLLKVFRYCSEDIGLHRDEVSRALKLVGILKPKQDLIDKAFSIITNYVNLSLKQWTQFVKIYCELQEQAIARAFITCDADRSGYVEVPELINLMRDFNIEPMSHVLREVLDEVDRDKTNSLDLEEFRAVMQIINVREGFTKSECEEFDCLFKKYDKDHSGEIDVHEMYSIVFWLGFAYELDTIKDIVRDVDCDGSGMLNEIEFLSCMRQLREAELARLRKAIADNDTDGNGCVSGEELRNLMSGLACFVDMDVVMEVAEQIGLKEHLMSRGLSLEELWQLLVVYRSREGFSVDESLDIEHAYKRFDVRASEELSTLDVGKVLRWLGYTPTFEEQQSLVAKVDVDGSGKLNPNEFRKLVRMLQVKEVDIARKAFSQRDKYNVGHISKETAAFALRAAGCVDKNYMTPKIRPEDMVNITVPPFRVVPLESFLRITVKFRKLERRAFRDNHGFSPKEIEGMTEKFKSYDLDGSGEISQGELIELIQDLLPRLAHDPAMRPRLLQLLEEVDADGSGTINFEDFVRLMQEINFMKLQERLAKEHDAIEKTHFSMKEVEEFRELFVLGDADDGNNDDFLALFKLKLMLDTICPLGDKNFHELKKIMKGALGKDFDDSPSGVTFPEFLMLMRTLLDVDFAGLQARLSSSDAVEDFA